MGEMVGGKVICLHEERWTKLERDREDDRKLLLDIHKRLFMDNGTPALMTRVDRMERVMSAVSVAVGSVIIAGLIGGATALFHHLWVSK